MRLDKFLKESRIIKRRTISKEACDSGKVFVNGLVAKAGTTLKIDDIITINFRNEKVVVKVLSFDTPIKKENASLLFEIIESTKLGENRNDNIN